MIMHHRLTRNSRTAVLTDLRTVATGRAAALALAAVVALAALLPSLPVSAVGASYVNDTPVTLTGPNITLQILAGSTVASLTVNSTTLVVNVAAGDAATVRYPGPNPGRLPNDGGLPECNNVGGNNDIVVNGPVTVTFTPNATACNPPSGGGTSSSQPATVAMVRPNGGETFKAGTQEWIFWSVTGGEPHTITLELSKDGGLTYDTTIASGEAGDGSYLWTIPDSASTQARVRIKSVVSGGIIRSQDVSDGAFTIVGTSQPSQPGQPEQPSQPTSPAAYDPTAAATESPTINDDLGLAVAPVPADPKCAANTLIKLPSDNDPATQPDAVVYYCGSDGRRYVFPNSKAFFTWFPDFSSVTVIDSATMAAIPLGGNVTYRPGIRMVKIQTDPKVYAIGKGGELRWVTTEALAAKYYGTDWNQKIDDVSDAFFVNYRIGAPITE